MMSCCFHFYFFGLLLIVNMLLNCVRYLMDITLWSVRWHDLLLTVLLVAVFFQYMLYFKVEFVLFILMSKKFM
jgi:hypothetical protein